MNDDRDFGPAIGGGARRDPRLSIRPPPRPSKPAEPTYMATPGPASFGWLSHAALAVLAIAIAAAGLILFGILLHIVWDAIMAGWRIG